jgi:hypothetical protein
MDIAIPAYIKSLLTGALLSVVCGMQPAVAQEAQPGPEQQPESQSAQPQESPAITEEPASAQAQEPQPSNPVSRPYWTVEIKGGNFEPELEEWETFYGDDRTDQSGLSVGYKFLRQVEVGLAIDYIKDKGVGTLPISGELGGEVEFELYPAHLHLTLRGIFFENQWVVPYVGGGVTRVYYRQAIENQASVRGKVEGDHTRAGLQFLLDWMDTGSASGFEEEGVENTYLTVEVLSFSAEIDGIELGGESKMIGLAFEF